MKTYRSVPFTGVDINMGFWQKRQQLNRDVTIKAVLDRFMDTGRFDAVACDWREGDEKKPHIFWDSDIAKWMESVAYLIMKKPMPELERVVEETIDKFEQNQDKYGYMNSYFTSVEPACRWQRRVDHELYCAGHLIEAAVAWKEATGRDRFLKMMCRYADYIYRVFVEEHSACFDTPGHQEIELALVKLYHATSNEKYLALSRYFVDKRGCSDRDKTYDGRLSNYDQHHLPAREQDVAYGHSVRAAYFYSAMADMAREDGDEALKSACEKLFDNIALRRMYVTAGIGSTHQGEAFTVDYDLPNETAYAETCAAIALAMFARRMLLLDADAKYADIIERVLYNGFLSGLSLDGKSFFYTNPLEIDASRRYADTSLDGRGDWLPPTQRVEVFACSCCPPNVTRFVASMGDYMFTEDNETIFLHQYIGAKANVSGTIVEVKTDYPADGVIHIHAENLKGRKLAVRIPGWCAGFELNAPYSMEKGYALIDGGDEIDVVLTLDMAPQLIEANPYVADAAGKVCVMRGPVVYCIEGVDNGELMHDCLLDAETGFAETMDEGYGLPKLTAKGWQRPAPEGDWLYRRFNPVLVEKSLMFIPYFAFANRGESDMRVWIPVNR